jgi:hypothetical protein
VKNGEEMMDILVDDIDRYEQLSNREELLALASALAGNGAVLEVVHTLDPIDPVDITGIPVAQTQNSVDPNLFLLSLIKCSVSSNVTTLCLSCRTPSSFDVSTLSGSTEFCV